MEILDILLGFENHLDNHESSKIYEMRGCEVFEPDQGLLTHKDCQSTNESMQLPVN